MALAHYDSLLTRLSKGDAPLDLMAKNDSLKQIRRLAVEARHFAKVTNSFDSEVISRVSHELTRSPEQTDSPVPFDLALARKLELGPELADRFSSASLDWETIAQAADEAADRVKAERKSRTAKDPAADDLGDSCILIWEHYTGQQAKRGGTALSPFEEFLDSVLDAAGVEIKPESLSKHLFPR